MTAPNSTAGTTGRPPRPLVPAPLFDAIPTELSALDRWVNWSFEWKDKEGKYSKLPIDSKNGCHASSTNPSTWSDLSTAAARYAAGGVDGVGIVLGDGLTGVDLDGHRDPETRVLTPMALGILGRLKTYAEVSPSGRGVHALLLATKPPGRCRRDDHGVEIYGGARYFTVTGLRLTDVPFLDDVPATVVHRQAELEVLCARLLNPDEPNQASRPGASTPSRQDGQAYRDALTDEDILRVATSARNGDSVRRLYAGDTAGYESQSEADLALCGHLAFYTGPDPARIDRLFRKSALYRTKWDEPRGELTYGCTTINTALEGRTEFYAPRAKPARVNGGHSPKIRVELPYWTEALDEMTHKAWGILQQSNDPPFLFRNGSTPVRIEFDDDGSPFLRPVNDHRLRHALMEVGEWYRWNEKEGDWERTALPAQLINNMLACPEVPLPLLMGIVEAPVFAGDGQLQTDPSYNPATKTFFDASSGIVVPPVSEHPSEAELFEARQLLLEEVLGDFPFVGDAERAHAVAMFILPFARELITGPTPLHLIEKPSPGTGATLLAELPGLLFTGRSTSAMTEGRDEDEWRKRLFAKLRKGPSIIFIDNLRRRLDSAAFSSAMTAWPFWEDRVLGVSETQRVPVRPLWLASGNNPAVSSEISRRTVRIRLDAKVDRPWLRKNFRHEDLRSWVKERRGQLVWACLTLVRAWIVAGRPRGSQILGMFEGWAGVMGGILEVGEIPGFLGNLAEFYDASDEEGAAGRMFLASWWEKHHDRGVGVRDLLQLATEVEGLDLGEGNELSQRSRLGKLLSRMRDRIVTVEVEDGPRSLRVTHGGTVKRAATWRLMDEVRVVRVGEGFPPNGSFFLPADRPGAALEASKHVDDPHPPSPEGPPALQKKSSDAENPHPPSPSSPRPPEDTPQGEVLG